MSEVPLYYDGRDWMDPVQGTPLDPQTLRFRCKAHPLNPQAVRVGGRARRNGVFYRDRFSPRPSNIAFLGARHTPSSSHVGRGTTRAEDAQGTPTQSHILPSILVYEDKASFSPCLEPFFGQTSFNPLIDSGLVGSTNFHYHGSRRCSRDTYPESYITKYTSIRRLSCSHFARKRTCA